MLYPSRMLSMRTAIWMVVGVAAAPFVYGTVAPAAGTRAAEMERGK
jgi:hypothetical protein